VNATRVLVIEDDPNIVDLVRSNLLVRGFEVLVSDGEDAVQLVRDDAIDIVLLDLNLPKHAGHDLCRQIREISSVGLIIVSARTQEHDKVRALNLGADDYLTKPFGVDELLARMSATLRRSRAVQTPPTHARVALGPVEVDLAARAVHVGGVRLSMTPTEFSLLEALVAEPGHLMSYEHLLRTVWGRGYENQREYVRVYVGRLRAKLEGAGVSSLIVTEPRAGYRIVVPTNA
jgi:two-component system KDP operon response regulator KdpE